MLDLVQYYNRSRQIYRYNYNIFISIQFNQQPDLIIIDQTYEFGLILLLTLTLITQILQSKRGKKIMMQSDENTELNKQMKQRILKLENRMRSKDKPMAMNEESVRTIKSTDSKKVNNTYKNKMIVFEERSQESHEDQRSYHLNLEQEIKNNRKITDYFPIKSSAKKQQTGNMNPQLHPEQKQFQNPKLPSNTPNSLFDPNANAHHQQPLSSNPYKSNTSTQEIFREQNKNLKQKLKLKQQSFSSFRSKIKKEMLEAVMAIHRLKSNEMKARVSQNRMRLGEFHIQKKGGDFWVDGAEIREVKQKIDSINKQKEQIEKCKKTQSKKPKQPQAQDPEQLKNTLQSQLHFLARQESYYQQCLKKLQQQKLLHIREYKLLYDQQHSKYGKIDSHSGIVQWPKIGNYQLMGLLGKGGFSQVYKGFDTEQLREVAVKLHELSPSWTAKIKQNFVKHAMREQGVHKLLNNPYIVKLYGTVEIDQNAFCTILEYCQGPDLSYYLKKHKRLPQKQAKLIIKQVISAINYLHELPEKVIHYDLKPQNILFHKGRIKITDFGLCKTTSNQIIELTSQGVGTYWYLPPQCFVTEEKAHISTKVDIWAIGVVYFEMLYGEKPFGNQMSQMRILSQGIMLKANIVNFPNTQPKVIVSNQSKQFIKACLKANPDQRLDIKGVLAHPLFQKR